MKKTYLQTVIATATHIMKTTKEMKVTNLRDNAGNKPP